MSLYCDILFLGMIYDLRFQNEVFGDLKNRHCRCRSTPHPSRTPLPVFLIITPMSERAGEGVGLLASTPTRAAVGERTDGIPMHFGWGQLHALPPNPMYWTTYAGAGSSDRASFFLLVSMVYHFE